MAMDASTRGIPSIIIIWCIISLSRVQAESATSSSPPPTQHWIQTPVPLYYLIVVGGLGIIILIICAICCICLQRKKHNQACIANGKHKNSNSQPSVLFNKSPLNLNESDVVVKQDSIDNAKEPAKESQEKCSGGGDGVKDKTTEPVENACTSDLDEPVWVLMDKEHEKQNEVLEEDNKNIRREPLYAKVKKEKKVKTTHKNVVYADLASFETNQDHQNQEKPTATEYAEITPLDQSLREMSQIYLND